MPFQEIICTDNKLVKISSRKYFSFYLGVFVVINIFTLISTSIDPARFNFYGNDGVLWPDILVSLQSIIVIAGYLFAANLPKVINNTLGVGNDKGMIAASESMKQTAKNTFNWWYV